MRKVYEKPYLEVVEYVGDYDYASGTGASDCFYLTCLIGQQSSENISGLTIYQFTYDGTTYYVWYYNYNDSTGTSTSYTFNNVTSFSSNFSKGTTEWYQGLMKSACSSISDSDFQAGLWHIATDKDGNFNAS